MEAELVNTEFSFPTGYNYSNVPHMIIKIGEKIIYSSLKPLLKRL